MKESESQLKPKGRNFLLSDLGKILCSPFPSFLRHVSISATIVSRRVPSDRSPSVSVHLPLLPIRWLLRHLRPHSMTTIARPILAHSLNLKCALHRPKISSIKKGMERGRMKGQRVLARALEWNGQNKHVLIEKSHLASRNSRYSDDKTESNKKILWQNILKYNFLSNILFSYLKPPDLSILEKREAWSEIDENELSVPEPFSRTV
jgi:hypothetical protein